MSLIIQQESKLNSNFNVRATISTHFKLGYRSFDENTKDYCNNFHTNGLLSTVWGLTVINDSWTLFVDGKNEDRYPFIIDFNNPINEKLPKNKTRTVFKVLKSLDAFKSYETMNGFAQFKYEKTSGHFICIGYETYCLEIIGDTMMAVPIDDSRVYQNFAIMFQG